MHFVLRMLCLRENINHNNLKLKYFATQTFPVVRYIKYVYTHNRITTHVQIQLSKLMHVQVYIHLL